MIRRRKEDGYTLTELMIVIAIVGAVYVLDETVTTVPSGVEQSGYKGAVVAIVQADKSIVVYGCDEVGKLMTGLQMTIKQ